MNLTRTIAPALLLAAIAGCSSNPSSEKTADVTVEDRNAKLERERREAETRQLNDRNRLALNDLTKGKDDRQNFVNEPWNDPKNGVLKRSVFFDYDSYIVRSSDQPLVESHANFLKNFNTPVVIQGSTDERGSREYNLALGQKRAEAVKKMLTLQGVKDSQIEAISYGEEQPRNPGHDETAWAENRRADLEYRRGR